MSFTHTQDGQTSLQGKLSTTSAECNFLQIEFTVSSRSNKLFARLGGPTDRELSIMHDAEVHVFSDYVLCQGMHAVNMPGIKFTEK